MKRALLGLIAGGLLAVLTGCCSDKPCCCCHPIRDFLGVGQGSCRTCPETASACEPCCRVCHGVGCPHCCPRQPEGTGEVAYPYYTLRGPRDFLARNPQSIGP
jgi:hypothetical protein